MFSSKNKKRCAAPLPSSQSMVKRKKNSILFAKKYAVEPFFNNNEPFANQSRTVLVDTSDGRGSGTYGNVYSAYYDNEQVAVKLIKYPEEHEDLTKEYNILCYLSHTKFSLNVFGLVKINSYDAGIVMELMAGSLKYILKKNNVSAEMKIYYALAAAMGLDLMHKYGVLHCDFKADNLLVTYGGILKIADMGAAKIMQTDGVATDDDILTTYTHASYSLFKDKNEKRKAIYSTITDEFSFWKVLFEIITNGKEVSLSTLMKNTYKNQSPTQEELMIFSYNNWFLTNFLDCEIIKDVSSDAILKLLYFNYYIENPGLENFINFLSDFFTKNCLPESPECSTSPSLS